MTSWIFEKEYEDYKKEQEYREFVENMRGGLNKELKKREKELKAIKLPDTDTLSTLGFKKEETIEELIERQEKEVRELKVLLMEKRFSLLINRCRERSISPDFQSKLVFAKTLCIKTFNEENIDKAKINNCLKELEKINESFELIKIDMLGNPFSNIEADAIFMDEYNELMKEIIFTLENKKETI